MKIMKQAGQLHRNTSTDVLTGPHTEPASGDEESRVNPSSRPWRHYLIYKSLVIMKSATSGLPVPV